MNVVFDFVFGAGTEPSELAASLLLLAVAAHAKLENGWDREKVWRAMKP